MDERMPSQRNGVAFDATGHDDPRRADLAALMRRPDGVPVHPYIVGNGQADDSLEPGANQLDDVLAAPEGPGTEDPGRSG
jgi:hypothetical protein